MPTLDRGHRRGRSFPSSREATEPTSSTAAAAEEEDNVNEDDAKIKASSVDDQSSIIQSFGDKEASSSANAGRTASRQNLEAEDTKVPAHPSQHPSSQRMMPYPHPLQAYGGMYSHYPGAAIPYGYPNPMMYNASMPASSYHPYSLPQPGMVQQANYPMQQQMAMPNIYASQQMANASLVQGRLIPTPGGMPVGEGARDRSAKAKADAKHYASKNMKFPDLLYHMLSDAEVRGFSHVMSFLPHGRAFMVKDMVEFEQYVMPLYYPNSRWKSFRRQLNLYDFIRITSGQDVGGYYHPNFLRGRRDLLKNIVRTKVKGERSKNLPQDDSTEVPDFYNMKPISPQPPLDQKK